MTRSQRHGKAQLPNRQVTLPYRLPAGQKTVVVAKTLRTNAGKKVKVSVVATDRTGNRPRAAKKSQFKVIRKPGGKVVVWIAKGAQLNVKVKLRAPATGKYEAYRYAVSYPGQGGDLRFVQEVFSFVFGKLFDSATGAAADSFTGWASSVIFGTTDPTKEIQAKLEAISAQVRQLTDDIAALRTATEFGFCKGDTVIAGLGLATIDTANNRYQTLLRTKDTTREDLLAWANDYVIGATKVEYALNQINRALNTGVEGAGSIGSCAQAMLLDWKAPLAEANYYERLYKYLNYFTQYQLVGANLVVEAYHLRAVDAAVKAGLPLPTKPEDISKVCAQPKYTGLGSVGTECNGALDTLTVVRNNIAEQAVAAGAGYAWSVHPDGVKLATQKGTDLVWVTDLNTYGKYSWCAYPLSSRPYACGPTVGNVGPLAVSSQMGYRSWQPATAAQWQALLAATPGRKVQLSTVLDNAGMVPGRSKGLLIYTGETSSGSTDSGLTWPGGWSMHAMLPLAGNYAAMCFADTNMTYGEGDNSFYCQGGRAYRDLANAPWKNPGGGKYGYVTSPWVSGDFYGDYYQAAFLGKRSPSDWDVFFEKMSIVTKPGWMSTDTAGPVDQYRWPVLTAPSGSGLGSGCSKLKLPTASGTREVDLLGRNNGGAVSMCAEDFRAWLASWLPEVPTS